MFTVTILMKYYESNLSNNNSSYFIFIFLIYFLYVKNCNCFVALMVIPAHTQIAKAT